MSTELSREEYERIVKDLCLMDDIFMTVVFKDKECTKELLSTILDMEVEIIDVKTQHEIKSLAGHSSRLDILAKDKDGRIINAEIQNDSDGAIPERARYHMGILDSNSLGKKECWGKLPDTYVIFITEKDVFGGGLPIYHIERTVRELNHKLFCDRSHIIYVNSKIRGETALGRLMYDLHCTEANKMYNPTLSATVSNYKDFSKGVNKEMSEIAKELINKGKAEGIITTTVKNIKSLMKRLECTEIQAMDVLEIPESEHSFYLKQLGLA